MPSLCSFALHGSDKPWAALGRLAAVLPVLLRTFYFGAKLIANHGGKGEGNHAQMKRAGLLFCLLYKAVKV